jgi:hypothetical protein
MMEEEKTLGGLDLHQTIRKLPEPAIPRGQFYNEDGNTCYFDTIYFRLIL